MKQQDGSDITDDDTRLELAMRRCATAIDQAAEQASCGFRLRLSCEILLPVFAAAVLCALIPGLLPGTWRVVSFGIALVVLAAVLLMAESNMRMSRLTRQKMRDTIAEEFGSGEHDG